MNRQYIGARYVPVFADPIEWDKLRSYEALTIVTHLSNTYTSKKNVPTGIDITNSEYWVVTGNFNSQLLELTNTVNKLNTSLENLSSEVTNDKSDIKNNAQNITELNTKTDNIESELNTKTSNIETEISNIKSKRIILIGDSYSEGYTPSGYITSWSDLLISNLPSIEFINLRKGGSGFINGVTFLNQLQNATVNNKETIDYIYVVGGYNDGSYDLSSITNAITSFCNYCKTEFINATIVIGFCGNNVENSSLVANLNKTYIGYKIGADTNKNCCYMNNIQYALLDNSLFSSDYYHPNTNGQTTLYRYVKDYILNNNIEVQSPYRQMTLTNKKFTGDLACGQIIHNNNVSLMCLSTGLTLTSTITGNMDGSTVIELCTLSNSFIQGSNSDLTALNIPGFCKVGSTYYMCGLTIYIKNHKLFVKPLCVISDNFVSGTISKIGFTTFNYIFDAYPVV